MSTNQNPEEEVELSKLLGVIGKGFSNISKNIKNFFSKLFHLFILSILFLKKNAIYLIGALVIGSGIGFFIKKYDGEIYFYEMEIIPNYESQNFISDKINNLNTLLYIKSYPKLTEILDLKEEDLKKIKSLKLVPVKSYKDEVLAYENFIKENDTIVSNLVTFKDFNSSSFSKFNTTRYYIDIIVFKPISDQFQDKLLESISNNPKFKLAKELKLRNLKLEEKMIRKGLSDIDSLRKTNRLVALKSAEHITTLGSDIDIVNSNDRKENEIEERNLTEDQNLYKTSDELIKKLNIVSDRQLKYDEIIRVISDLSFKGLYTKTVTSDPVKLYGILGFIGALAVILLLKFNIYLKNYKK